MVIVHVLNDSRFFCRGKWIFRHEFVGFYPADPSKSTDESNPYELKQENREGMRLVILTCGWKVSELSLASGGFIMLTASMLKPPSAGLACSQMRV